ncbi:MAG: exo-alpha-sialidase [Clostridia bacterium]|nr:exo-alpha-sialidase [Clostridia bacterium]
MKKRLSLFFAVLMFLTMLVLFVSAEESEITLDSLTSVTASTGSFQTVDVGDKIFTNRTYTFGESIPSYLIGKPYLQTALADTVTVTAATDGYVYVLAEVAGTTETSLFADGFTKIDTIPTNTLWEAHKVEVAVMAKEVKKGDTFSYGKWGLLIADFAINPLASASSTNGSFSTVTKGNSIFTNRDYAFGEIPDCLCGLSYLKTGISSDVLATVTEDGYVYVLTQVDGTSNAQEAALVEDGFTKIATIGKGLLWSTLKYEVAVMAKEVKKGDTINYGYWGLLLANEGKEEFELNALATVMPKHEKPRKIAVGERIFADTTKHVFAESMPEYLLGQSYLATSVDLGGTFTVTKSGYLYIVTSVSGNTTSQADKLVADGFAAVASIDAKIMSTTISESLVLLAKEVEVGETVSFGRWGMVIAETDENYAYLENSISLNAPTVIYNPTEGEYIDGNRLWQGIPSITKDEESGRLWATWYSGGEGEGAYNFVLLYTSDDDGKTWSGPVLAIDHEFPVRCFDPNLWMDPDGRMWMFWTQSYFHKDGVYGTWMMYTDNPESENPTWSEPKRVANGITMNDPIVLSNGDWLLPTAIWAYANTVPEMEKETNSNVYISKDKGMNWEYLGSVPSYEGERNCDENMIVEQADGSLRMLIRTGLGIEESYSYDGGETWTGATDADISNVASRFYITRLSSGNQLLVFNDPPNDGTKRTHMTAALSADDGKTWSHKLVIDERSSTTYPDAVEDDDGNIYIIYDHGRGVNGEILMAKITEADIIAGELITSSSSLKVLINNNTVPDPEGSVPATDSLESALKVLDGRGGIVVLKNDITVSDGTVIPEQAGDLTITSTNGAKLILSGSLTFEKNTNDHVITLDVPVSSEGGVIYGGFNSVTFTENFSVDGTLDFYGGFYNVDSTTNGAVTTDASYYYEQNKLLCTELPYDIVVNSGTFRNFMGGNYRATHNSLLGSIAAPITVTINGGTFGEGVAYDKDTALKIDKAFSISGMSILADDATLTVNGGTFNTPIYAQGYIGATAIQTSGCSQYTNSDKKFYAADGDIVININGGVLNGFELSAAQLSASYCQLLRGNYTVTVAEGATLAENMIFDATQVKGYEGSESIATITYPSDKTVSVRRFDNVNGEAQSYEEPLRIACIGDSITQGVRGRIDGVDNYELASYPAVLYQKMYASDSSVVISNYGCSGARVMDFHGKQFIQGLAYTLSMEESDPDYVIIGLGTNDANLTTYAYGMQDRFYEEFYDFVDGYENLESTDTVFVTSPLYRVSNDVAAVSNIRALQKMACEALGKGVTYVDLYALLLDESLAGKVLCSDNLHPHAEGYVLYADTIYDAIVNGVCTLDGFEQEHIYVSADGTNNMEATESNPTNNISIAFAKAKDNSVIHIIGTYDYTKADAANCGFPTPINVKNLTIVGEESGATLNINAKHLHIKNDATFDNIGIYTSSSGTLQIACGYHNVTFTETFKCEDALFAAGMVALGLDKSEAYYNSRESISSDRDCVITVNGGNFNYFLGGNFLFSGYEYAIYGTYGGNMILNVGPNVNIAASVRNGACGQNYLTGSITLNAASWSDEPIREYSYLGGALESESYNIMNNTGTVTVNLAEGFSRDIAIAEDLNGDGTVNVMDVLVAAKYVVNGMSDDMVAQKSPSFYGITKMNLLNVVRMMKKVTVK